MISESTKELLITYADRYEKRSFIEGDPSWFMHQVRDRQNQEAMAFVASCLSYGSRKQFMIKIQELLDLSHGEVDRWIREGEYKDIFRDGDKRSFYRLYSYETMYRFFEAYRRLMQEHGTLGEYVRNNASDGLGAVEAITAYFSACGVSVVIPKDTQSACKRVCMFLRWMVRTNSEVDLGLWSDFIDQGSLIMPLDTHVLQQSVRLGLLRTKTATMSTAIRLTKALSEVFPGDPLKADFALFGFGVNNTNH